MKKASNKLLRNANKAKNDEFYTQRTDIEKELKYYKKHLKGKVVYCNADDPFESNFFKYFASNFNELGLKKLITTSYAESPIVGKQLPLFEVEGLKKIEKKEPYKIEINEVKDTNNDGAVDITDVEYLLKNDKNTATPLKDNGDFRSEECIELLKQVDIVITNPPFSLFREYVEQLIKYKKKFLIIGNQNAITYKDVFRLIKDNKLWLGVSMNGSNRWFEIPNYYEKYHKIEKGKKYAFVAGVVWFTNLDHNKRHEELILHKKYNKEDYPRYENYKAIDVSKVVNIPIDYNGFIGVPVTFLHKYNPEQFEIIGLGISNSGIEIGVSPYKEKHRKYRKEIQKRAAVNGDLYKITEGKVDVPYARMIIKNKKISTK